MFVTTEDDEWADALERAARPRNQAAVRAMQESIAAGHDRFWWAALALQPTVGLTVAILCWQAKAEAMAITVVAGGASLVIGGLIVAIAGRAWGDRHLNPLAPLDRAARRSIRQQVSLRATADPGARPVTDVVAAWDYRQRVLGLLWTGFAFTQLARLTDADDAVELVLVSASGLLTLTAGWLVLLQAVRAARYVRRST